MRIYLILGFLSGGPFYHLIGRTGNNVGRVRGGKNTFSMRPHPSSKPPTESQLDAREEFAFIVTMLKWITALIRVGYQVHKPGESAMNAAVSYNIKHAVTGIAPNYVLDYPKFMYSTGMLSGPTNPEVETTVVAQLKFNWDDSLETGIGSATDLATLLVYNPAKDRFIPMVAAAARSVMTYTLTVPGNFSGDTVHCYMSFVSVDGKTVSDSVHIGGIAVL
ncbi:MAG: hypothetical protein EOO89_29035 [Pedobacter sp.]|nr:MAG: hypothetical protein EOO89_29035 [Pedobacter sp.]